MKKIMLAGVAALSIASTGTPVTRWCVG